MKERERGQRQQLRGKTKTRKKHIYEFFPTARATYTVSGQNTIGIYIIPLAPIQHTAQKQNIICDNQLFKLQPAVTNKMLYLTMGF